MKIIFPDNTVYEQKPETIQGLWDIFKVPSDGRDYAFLRHDWQTPVYGYKPRSIIYNDSSPNIALPETVQFRVYESFDFVPMTEAMQYYHLALLSVANPDVESELTLKQQMQALYGQSVAFTDRHAWNTGDRYDPPDDTKNFAFYPTNLNLDNSPCSWKCGISTGGNLVHVKKWGTVCEIETLDVNDVSNWPTPAELFKMPWLCHMATIESGHSTAKLNFTQKIDGVQRTAWEIEPFPQVRNINAQKTGTPFMLMGLGGHTRVDLNRILPASAGVEFSMYVP